MEGLGFLIVFFLSPLLWFVLAAVGLFVFLHTVFGKFPSLVGYPLLIVLFTIAVLVPCSGWVMMVSPSVPNNINAWTDRVIGDSIIFGLFLIPVLPGLYLNWKLFGKPSLSRMEKFTFFILAGIVSSILGLFVFVPLISYTFKKSSLVIPDIVILVVFVSIMIALSALVMKWRTKVPSWMIPEWYLRIIDLFYNPRYNGKRHRNK